MTLVTPEPASAPSLEIWSHPLAPVTARLQKKGMADAERLETEFRRFAAICLHHPDEHLAPSRLVDEYWHEAILDTARYRDFCERVYGAPLDHLADDAGAGMRAQFETTLTHYRARFGEPDPHLWDQPGNSMTERRVPRPPRA